MYYRINLIGVAILGLALVSRLDHRGLAEDMPGQASSPQGAKLPKRVEEILWWFPVDTQTVIVDQGPADVQSDSTENGFGALPLIGCPASVTRDTRVLLVVEGARRFRGPKGLGVMPF